MTLNRKTALGTLITLVILIVGYRYFTHPNSTAQQGNAVPVNVAKVIEKTITKWDEFTGVLTAVDHVEIRPRVAGVIESIHFQEGQMVEKGQLLFIIDPKPYEAEEAKADAALMAAKSQAIYAQREYERASTLLAQHVISEHDFDAKKDLAFSAKANVKAAESTLKQAKLNLGYTHILAPVAGRVSRAEITQGNLVNAGGEAPILTSIVSLDPIYMDFDADEQSFIKYLHINGNDPEKLKNMTVTMGLGEDTIFPYHGKLKSFDNSVNSRAGTIRVRALFPNEKGALVPGLFARIRMSGSGPAKAILINERAIGTDQNKKFVLVVAKDNKIAYREVKPGVMANGLRVITEGLQADEIIIVNGLQHAQPGAMVTPQEVSMETLEVSAVKNEKK